MRLDSPFHATEYLERDVEPDRRCRRGCRGQDITALLFGALLDRAWRARCFHCRRPGLHRHAFRLLKRDLQSGLPRKAIAESAVRCR